MDTEAPVRLAVIIGSTREGRVGEAVARWFLGRAERRKDFEVDVVDLVDYAFPARYPATMTPPIAEFTARIERAEAYVVVTPEYNRSFPASLKQAIDYAYDEWQAKPVGFVSYGSGSDGVYAVEQLRTVFTELQTVAVRDSVRFNLLEGHPLDTDHARQAAKTMLDQLTWWGLALRAARATRPYVS
jgi:NAD(P)H-dependent FMN reductase